MIAPKPAPHTPTPWQYGELSESVMTARAGPIVDADFARDIISYEERFANLKFIVRACNAHDALVAALREIEANNADPLDVEIARAALAQVRE
jgi:hypothetical protein